MQTTSLRNLRNFKVIKKVATSFDQCIAFVLRMEGGYSKDPRDPGGETNFGISRKSHPGVNIKKLSEDKAKAIYMGDYWYPIYADLLPMDLKLIYFDCAVNQGKDATVKIIQHILDLTPDGVAGPKTRAAFKKILAKDVQDIKYQIIHMRFSRYIGCGPKLFKTYGRGWTHRLMLSARCVIA